MEFLQSHSDNNWGIWAPIIGGILLYFGLNIYLEEIETDEE